MGLARIWWPVLPVLVFLAVWGPVGAALEAVVMAAVIVAVPRLRARMRSAPMRTVERIFRLAVALDRVPGRADLPRPWRHPVP